MRTRLRSNAHPCVALAMGVSLLFAIIPVQAAQPDDDARGNPTATYQEGADGKQLPPGLDVAELKRRRDMVRNYLAKQRAKLDVVATTVTDSGQVIDWIRPETQVETGELASPPPDPLFDPGTEDGSNENILSVSELAQQVHARGPKGTVPVVRRDLDEVINNMLPPGSIQDFLSKSGNAQDIPDPEANLAENHMYAKADQSGFNIGSAGYINVWNPYVAGGSADNYSGEFSLGQVGLANRAAPGETETIEAGWQDFPALYGDNYPHFFTYFTTVGYLRSGDYVGGYNRDVDGWVQFSGTIFPGMRLTSTSTRGGVQVELHVAVRKWGSNWWIYANGEWVGYYPASLFDRDRLGTRATQISWFGEIVDLPDGRATFTDMGSGAHASEGYRNAAYMRNLTYYDEIKGAPWDFVATHTYVSDSRCYSLQTHSQSGQSWRSYLYWGGPGRTNYYTTECGTFQYTR